MRIRRRRQTGTNQRHPHPPYASAQTRYAARWIIAAGGSPPTTTTHTRSLIMTRKILTVLMMLGMFGTLSAMAGCNTMAGAGKDIERGGQKVQDEAREVQHKM
jgi:entericidin B